MFQLKDCNAVVTGAGSGIGRAISISMARRKANLIITDIDENRLRRTGELVEEAGGRFVARRLDVSDEAAVNRFAEIARTDFRRIDVLVNNAGVALGGAFLDVESRDFEWLFSVNFWGVVHMTRAFLPLLQQSPDARLVNISSAYGLVAPPGLAAYAASKFAVRGFTESVRHELEGTSVGVTLVHPGGVRTRIAVDARIPHDMKAPSLERESRRFDRHLKLPASAAGEIIVKAIEKRKPRVLVGSDAKMISVIERFAPLACWSIIRKFG